uniref:Uncharacterized protein n=1 Tax=Urocitellus parryii TaxID=9999 RepID=A0A8D2ILP3_UROPR
MLTNCRGVHTRQFILRAGQKPLLILVAKTPTSSRFMTRKNSSRKAGAKTRRSKRSLLMPAQGAPGGIQWSMSR